MVKHLAYFDALGSFVEQTPPWQSALAGLAMLRLAQPALEKSPAPAPDWAAVFSARKAATRLAEGNPIRSCLVYLIDTIEAGALTRGEIGSGLISYARALNFEGSWALAMDVYATVAESVGPGVDPNVSIEANIGLGGMARRIGDWDKSATAYAHAAHMAQTIGDSAKMLTVEIGQANTALIRGNLPAAQTQLDSVIGEARTKQLRDVLGLALHSRSSVAHARGDYADAIRLAYESLDYTTNMSARDVVLADLAASFGGLGMHDAARDGYLVVAATSQYQWVRWQATLNLMELAALDGLEKVFDDYAVEMSDAPLDPRLRAHYLLYLGTGQLKLGRVDCGKATLDEAAEFASRHQLNQVAYEAMTTLAGTERDARAPVSKSFENEVTADVLEAASSLSRLRETTVRSP